MKDKEENFISAVVITHNNEDIIVDRLTTLYAALSSIFKYFEIIVVNNYSNAATEKQLKDISIPITTITLSSLHNTQDALTAGVEFAVGDYILEIPNLQQEFDPKVIKTLYETCQKGNDFVFLEPQRLPVSSKLFYFLMNYAFKGKIKNQFVSSLMTLSSRRGQNKTSDIGTKLVNRNVAYVLTGLNCASVQSPLQSKNHRSLSENTHLMIDTFIYYTNYITRFAIAIAIIFLGFCFFAQGYGIICYFTINTAPGWTTLFSLISLSFGALFGLLAIICKYLSNLIQQQKTKTYTFSSVDRYGQDK